MARSHSVELLRLLASFYHRFLHVLHAHVLVEAQDACDLGAGNASGACLGREQARGQRLHLRPSTQHFAAVDHYQVWRRNMSANPQHVVDTEDAAELNLGDDFRNETCLSNAEVAVILEKQKSDYETQEKQLTNVFQKTYSYVQRFSGTKDPVANQASVTELREALMSLAFQREEEGETVEYRLEEFEIACLSNLNPEEVEEAVALIPSLHKRFAEDEIEEILGIVSRTAARMFG
ncbi:DNA-directed RNA polymerase II subunit 4 [Phytophthora citrophthora]|nr:DNA-directed RNA polymerase II subunit 4 [Phytophthora citrophthora]